MKRYCIFLLFPALMLLILSACNLPQQTAAGPEKTGVTPEEEIAETPEPTETPTPLPVREKIVFVPSDEFPDITENLRRSLETVCLADFECVPEGSADSIDEDTAYAVFAGEPQDLASLVQRFPDTQFIVAAAPGVSLENAWVIQYDEAFYPFLAGLATASSAADWRCAGLIPSDSPVWGSHAEEAFLNGAHYFCGNCMSSLAPYVSFPLAIALPSNSSPDTWNAQFDEAQRSFIYTAFLSDEAISDTLLQKMIDLNIQVLGVSGAPAGMENHWLAGVKFDWAETVRQIIERSASGSRQGTIPVVLSVTPGRQSDRFSEGKTNILRSAYADLLSGMLSPYTASNEYTE